MTARVGLADPSSGVREHALRLAESRLGENKLIRDKAIALAADDNIRVRFQAAFSLGETTDPRAAAALADIAAIDAGDYWMRTAILSSSLNLAWSAAFIAFIDSGRLRVSTET